MSPTKDTPDAPVAGETTTTSAPTASTTPAAASTETAPVETKNKRQADRQITKDDGDDDDGDEDTLRPGSFPKASEEVLANRRILKVKRPAVSDSGTKPVASSNPFAATNLTASTTSTTTTANADTATTAASSKPIFGASTSFGGFAAAAAAPTSGFGSAAATSSFFGKSTPSNPLSTSTTSSTSAFGSAFDTTSATGTTASGGAPKSAFTSLFSKPSTNTHTFSFGKPASTTTTTESSPQKTSDANNHNNNSSSNENNADESNNNNSNNSHPAFALQPPNQVDLSTGEENEVNLHEGRCKSFHWVLIPNTPAGDANADETSKDASSKAAIPSVKPSESFQIKATESKDDKASESETAAASPTAAAAAATTTAASSNTAAAQHRWKELGIGPLKLLQNQSDPAKIRLVQRRESSPNGNATKVILNLPLWKECNAQLKNKGQENYLSFTTPDEHGDTSTYLLRFKTVMEARTLLFHLHAVLPTAKSCFGGGGTAATTASEKDK